VVEAVAAERDLALKLASAVAGVIAVPLDATKHDVEDLKRELADLRARVQNIEIRIQDIERRLGEVRKTARDA
jgi:predicted  nucleic acid-binding Zn-ribbon protein